MTKHISMKGVVQGVGFCPFVYGLATRFNLHGWVCNTSTGVEILVQGQTSSIESFLHSLNAERPPQARIDNIEVYDDTSDIEYRTFEIRTSMSVESADPSALVDVAICPDCERELFDPKDRRYLYPFISCAHCGPRFTIIKDLPYDRLNTTMAEFGMCEHCGAEYNDPLGRHFQAQPIACPQCGPFVALRENHTRFSGAVSRISSIELRTSAILKARRLLREGYILGIKSLGGFYLACDASNSLSVEELRDRKGCIEKPFALMTSDVEFVRSICHVNHEEETLLTGREKPIVLLKKKPQAEIAQKVSSWVAPHLDTLGMMLPYTPLQHLLLNQTDLILSTEPVPPLLVMTSGNVSEEPISIDDEDALQRLAPLADAFLVHNRDIYVRCDDSVVRVDHRPLTIDSETNDTVHRPSSTVYLRRSRGYAPYPIQLPIDVRPTLAVGGDLKNTFSLARAQHAFISPHMGDTENPETIQSFEKGIGHLSHILHVQPELIAHDLRTDSLATEYAAASTLEIPHVGVQHHHAHIVSCMVDNGLADRRVIGISFDGAGYGTDGMIWGGEVILASFADFERFAHLEYLPIPNGDSASRAPWSIAASFAYSLGIDIGDLPFIQHRDWQMPCVERNGNALLTSSMSYLFDAVAGLIGARNDSTYAAQAAVELEVLAKPFVSTAKSYPYVIDKDGIILLKDLLNAIVQDVGAGRPAEMIAACFHRTIVDIAIDICRRARESTGLNEVALSGDLWQNQILLELVREGLKRAGFVVYFHQQIPTNDEGLALGQVVIANCSIGMQEIASSNLNGKPSSSKITQQDH